MLRFISNEKITADELFNGNSCKEIAPIRDTIKAQRIVIEDEKSEMIILAYEIEEYGKNVEKVIGFLTPGSLNKENTAGIRKELLLKYLSVHANPEQCCISMRAEDADQFTTNVLEGFGYKQVYHQNPEMTLFKKVNS